MIDSDISTFEVYCQVLDNILLATELAEAGDLDGSLEHFKLAGELLEAIGYEPDWPARNRRQK